MIVHIHIPKCGGTTFNLVLHRRFRERFLSVYDDNRPGWFLTPEEARRLLESRPDAQAIAGHCLRHPLPPIEGRVYRYATFLRDPVERAVSVYFNERKVAAAQGGTHCCHLPFEAYVEVRPSIDNAISDWQTFHLDPEGDLEKAKDALRQFDMVGVVEAYDETIVSQCARLGIPLRAMTYVKMNASKQPAREPLIVSSAARRRLESLNARDIELHRFARELLDKAIHERGRSFHFALACFDAANRLRQAAHRVRYSRPR